ncbi:MULTISPECIES: Cof-type HAD-IIB family hydrolase [Gordonia]|uniref:Cof-type HAD-IIB family hydrolase n=1 Tax=Gordonia amicalis TaxID=89053 RepID=A0AAE4R3H7_9ACTN|nr:MULTISPECIES: Cof-type HAD-IIB family hydrolase [Gordonia]ATD69069.1 Cof-type HAD-IIB family hydrolase [Gordonia sp. 1D]KAF0967507.1 5-amino-6-(5-phospho-D-ribitylamino)uracil phosphatase YitU [Gordonia sp. YY1]MBA5847676.1 Cof-type HAD-IIB family hydrolase [Gordonia amicalis]MCZ0911018.1 Cof-type HAD-IIB family hydrolase [Gordonia amicalis]MCZ4580371.1 Cof-type HAD-IIB family hydrolase [Gordonia amicalis]
MTFGPPTLIASDVDGTLIDDENRVSSRTVSVLSAARAAGVEFVLATGRPPRWIAEITDQFAGTDAFVRYAVCANGAIIYDAEHDRVLWSANLEPDVLGKLGEIAYQQIPGCGIAAERAGRSAHDAATAPFVASAGYEHAWLNPDHVEVGDDEVFSQSAVKLLVRKPDMPSGEMAERLQPFVGDLAQVTFSTDNGLVELSVPGTHKASGLARLCEATGLPDNGLIAFGDMPNDVEMLSWASHGVAMGHSHQAALDAADEVTVGNNDDGVARVLERWFA